MNKSRSQPGTPLPPSPDRVVAAPIPESPLTLDQWRQFGLITVAALAIFAFLRWLPTGTDLTHMDFRVDAKNSIEFCDPLNPQFIPVVAVASPVSLSVKSPPVRSGEFVNAIVTLRTSNGKPVATHDLLVVHTRPLHLLISDPSLTDYQHVHPEPTGQPGEWSLNFTPIKSGAYRIFADFTPAATGRGLYATADLEILPGSVQTMDTDRAVQGAAEDDYTFALTPGTQPLRARKPLDLKFTITRADGAGVPLEPVMDAYAHLVAFDESRSGFAHLHPMLENPSQVPDRVRPSLDFKVTIPKAGRYVVWSQVNLAGSERFVPFWFDVVE